MEGLTRLRGVMGRVRCGKGGSVFWPSFFCGRGRAGGGFGCKHTYAHARTHIHTIRSIQNFANYGVRIKKSWKAMARAATRSVWKKPRAFMQISTHNSLSVAAITMKAALSAMPLRLVLMQGYSGLPATSAGSQRFEQNNLCIKS